MDFDLYRWQLTIIIYLKTKKTHTTQGTYCLDTGTSTENIDKFLFKVLWSRYFWIEK